LRAGIGDFAFRQHKHTSGWRKLNGCAQSGDSGSDDEKINLRGVGWHVLEMVPPN
jgi:hypothetical protein